MTRLRDVLLVQAWAIGVAPSATPEILPVTLDHEFGFSVNGVTSRSGSTSAPGLECLWGIDGDSSIAIFIAFHTGVAPTQLDISAVDGDDIWLPSVPSSVFLDYIEQQLAPEVRVNGVPLTPFTVWAEGEISVHWPGRTRLPCVGFCDGVEVPLPTTARPGRWEVMAASGGTTIQLGQRSLRLQIPYVTFRLR